MMMMTFGTVPKWSTHEYHLVYFILNVISHQQFC